MKMRFFLALFSVVATLSFGAAEANSLLASPNPNPGEKFPLQGDCARHGIDYSNVDQTVSTLACTGASTQMLRIFYSNGPQACVYIDNFNNDGGQLRAFFVPLRTSDEWVAFSSYPPGGVRLRYGCPGQIFKDSCGNSFGLPDMPASDDPKDIIKISTPGGYNGEFSCPLTLAQAKTTGSVVGGCGAWKAVKESGDCTPAITADDSKTPPGTPGEPPSTVLPPGPPVGIPPAKSPVGFPSTNPPPGLQPSEPPVGIPPAQPPVGIPPDKVPTGQL